MPCAAELRCPQERAGVPGRAGVIGVLEPASRLQHAHPVALLGEPQSGHGAAEARADHEHVVVVRVAVRVVVVRAVVGRVVMRVVVVRGNGLVHWRRPSLS